MAATTKKLTAKEGRFVELYLQYADVRKAAVEAGFADSVAKTKAYQWVSDSKSKPHVYAAVKAGQARLSEATGITQERIMAEYAKIGFSDIRRAVRWRSNILATAIDPDTGEAAGIHVNDVEFINSDELTDDMAACISEVGKDSKGGLKLKLYDKKTALDSMAKAMGMFDRKRDETLDGGTDLEEMNLRALGRKLAHVLNGATEAVDEPA